MAVTNSFCMATALLEHLRRKYRGGNGSTQEFRGSVQVGLDIPTETLVIIDSKEAYLSAFIESLSKGFEKLIFSQNQRIDDNSSSSCYKHDFSCFAPSPLYLLCARLPLILLLCC